MAQDSAAVELLIAEVSDAIRRAYSEGVRRGSLDAVEKMTRAVSRSVSPLPAKAVSSQEVEKPRIDKRSQGSIINLFRVGLRAAGETGLSRQQLVEFCKNNGLNVTPNQYREIMKRLTGGEEAIRKYGVYFTGPQFRDDLIPETDNPVVLPPEILSQESPRRRDHIADAIDEVSD